MFFPDIDSRPQKFIFFSSVSFMLNFGYVISPQGHYHVGTGLDYPEGDEKKVVNTETETYHMLM